MNRMKKAAGVAKLQGELALIDRQVTECTERHGVTVYEMLAKRLTHLTLQHGNQSHDNEEEEDEDAVQVKIFPGLQAAFQAATEDLKELNEKRNKLQEELDIREESSTANSKSGVGGFLTNTKLKTQLAYYEREIRLRQGIFGHQLVDDLQLMTVQPADEPFDENDENDGMVATVLNQMRRELQEVLQRKEDKQAEIDVAKATA